MRNVVKRCDIVVEHSVIIEHGAVVGVAGTKRFRTVDGPRVELSGRTNVRGGRSDARLLRSGSFFDEKALPHVLIGASRPAVGRTIPSVIGEHVAAVDGIGAAARTVLGAEEVDAVLVVVWIVESDIPAARVLLNKWCENDANAVCVHSSNAQLFFEVGLGPNGLGELAVCLPGRQTVFGWGRPSSTR